MLLEEHGDLELGLAGVQAGLAEPLEELLVAVAVNGTHGRCVPAGSLRAFRSMPKMGHPR